MEFKQTRKNEEKQINQNSSKGGIISQRLMDTKLMQQKAKEHQAMFGTMQREENRTGLPDNLKSGMESLSGMSLDNVKVHYNSSKPASVQAHAFASGNDIHIASGQEKHLPHELGHVVQQAEGRVKPTANIGGVAVNDSPALESEATKMGNRAMQMYSKEKIIKNSDNKIINPKMQLQSVIQATIKETPPKTNGRWEANMNGTMAGAPEVQNNFAQAGTRTGSQPGSASPDGWAWLIGQTQAKGSWVRFHLINENIGGKGENANLVPTSQQVNLGSKWKKYETAVKNKFFAGYWIWSKTVVTPGDATYQAGWPSKIEGYTEWFDDVKNQWKTSADLRTELQLSPPDIQGGGPLLLDEMSKTQWKLVLGKTNFLDDKVNLLNSLSTPNNSSLDDIDANLQIASANYMGDDIYSEFTKNDWTNISYAVNQKHQYVSIQL